VPPPGITLWTRLEPLDTSSRLDVSLSAAIADPLWLLHRQWQLGELDANDAGTPIAVTIESSRLPLTRYRAGDPVTSAQRASAYDPAKHPLEPLVEGERVRGIRDRHRRLAAETGQHFLRLLSAAGFATLHDGYRTAFTLPLTPSTAPEADPLGAEAALLLGGRAVDGDRLATELRAAARAQGGTLTTLPPSCPGGNDPAGVARVAVAWLAWYDALLLEPDTPTPRAWAPRRLEHQFAVAAVDGQRATTYGSTAFDDGRLDWPDFAGPVQADLGPSTGRTTKAKAVTIPVPLAYPGMPAHRHWEIEDSRVSFAGVEAGSTDVVRILMTDFALIYGDDWFIVPVEMPVGAQITIDALRVRDTFGIVSPVAPVAPPQGGTRRWAMYEVAPGAFLLPPTLAGTLSGRPIEEVALFRDEMANLVWAVERTTPSRLGTPIDRYRYNQPTTRVEVNVTDVGDADLVYRLTTPVPANWIPYLPKRTPAGDDIALERLAGSAPEGAIANETSVIEDEEVNRAGLVVERAWHYARWTGGQPCLWLGRHVYPGRGEGSSGLAWDQTEPPPGAD
jgi:hypothetical protein